MLFTVDRAGRPPLTVEADEHRVEGAHHVFRCDTVVLRRPRSVVTLRLPAAEVRAVVAVGPHGEEAAAMARRFDVPLDDLEATARVADTDRVETEAEPRQVRPLQSGPQLHPYGDGLTSGDGDGD